MSRSVAGQLSPVRRASDLRRLRAERFDVLVIGGGVTGAGAALDAASRGLKVALVEARDLAAGTSSRSSKLIHGGLRYLEQLEFHLVHEALTERGLLATRLAPHLVRPVPIMVPLPAGRGLNRQAREVTGVRVRDLEAPPGSPDAEFEVQARTVIAATGVWSDDMSRMLNDVGLRPGVRVRASKGVHLVVPRSAITGETGLILRTASSVLFVIPWGGHWIIGTTDTDWRLDRSHPAASARDIDYLLQQVNTVLDRPLTTADIEGVYA
ncbi:FAD-dependent oxidoreductase, partial [Micromonospora sp. M51]|uniref:FAD-dependent oxidoreductase n=1 Tax=Micromonospora sp. M51 TaxID=2824889 RepID=UPI001B381129